MMGLVAYLDLRDIATKVKYGSAWVDTDVPLLTFQNWNSPEKVELGRKGFYFQLSRLRERYPVPKGEAAQDPDVNTLQ
jgi:hypothetical protein